MLHQIAVKAIIVRDRTFLALYSDEEGQRFWDLPGGRLAFGEDMETAMIREGREELGCTLEPLRLLDTWDVMKNDAWQVSGVFYLCRLSGDADIVLSDEHTGYIWLPIDDFARAFTARTLLERMQRWDWDRMLRDAACFAYPVAWMKLQDLVPNNLFINSEKLARLQRLTREDFNWNLPPVTVSVIGGNTRSSTGIRAPMPRTGWGWTASARACCRWSRSTVPPRCTGASTPWRSNRASRMSAVWQTVWWTARRIG